MTNPIEVMAKAIAKESTPDNDWEYIKSVPGHPLYEMSMAYARAALLALSECDLPGDGRDEDREFLFHFRAMLKKISEGK